MYRGKSFNQMITPKQYKNARPKSSFKSSTSYPSFNNNSSIFIKSPKLILSRPNSASKKLKGMGNKFEREELYQLNQELKTKVNMLKQELHEVKGQITKKDREIKRKEKLIEDCYKEIHNPSSLYQKSFDQAKESTLLSLCKEQYKMLKKEYDKKLEENEVLKMNIKITQIKEYKIQINILQSEMKKLKNLYKSSVNENFLLKNKIKELMEFRSKYTQQHTIINTCMKKVKDYNHNLLKLELANEELQNELKKKRRTTQFFKNQNNKLKLSNEKFLKDRKTRDYYNIFKQDNENKIMKLKKELAEYKRLYNISEQQIKQFTRNNENKTPHKKEEIKEFDYNQIIYIEKEPEDGGENQNKIKLLKSLLEEKQKEVSIFTNFLLSYNINPDSILQGISINVNLDPNTNNNISNSLSIKNDNLNKDKIIKKNSKIKNVKVETSGKKDIDLEDKNKNSNLNSFNSNSKNTPNEQNEENNSQLYNAAVINSNNNEINNNSEEPMKDSELTSNNNEFNN